MHEIQVEGTFPDGVFLVTVHEPVASALGDLKIALYGSFLPIPPDGTFGDGMEEVKREDVPGAITLRKEPIKINVGRKRVKVKVTNLGDRPIQVSPVPFRSWFLDEELILTWCSIQVGSHYHFTEVNKSLSFDRSLSLFRHLDIAAGTAVRFEPGDSKTVTLVDIAGERSVTGGNNLVNTTSAALDDRGRALVVSDLVKRGFAHVVQEQEQEQAQGFEMSRETYASMYGPTTGDKVRLGDTELWIEVEKDLTVYGDELKFGGGESRSSLLVSSVSDTGSCRQGH